jgi:hypothetical protein
LGEFEVVAGTRIHTAASVYREFDGFAGTRITKLAGGYEGVAGTKVTEVAGVLRELVRKPLTSEPSKGRHWSTRHVQL